MSTFVAKLPSPELSLALQRRMSSVAPEEESKEDSLKKADVSSSPDGKSPVLGKKN